MFQFLEDSIIRSFYLLGAESARDDNSVGDNKVFRVTATKCSLTVISLTVKLGELCRRQACLKFPTKSQNNSQKVFNCSLYKGTRFLTPKEQTDGMTLSKNSMKNKCRN